MDSNFTKIYTKDDAFYKFESSGGILTKKYKLVIDELPNLIKNLKISLTNAGSYSASQLKMNGVECKYTIEMPGKITNINGGGISKDGKTVTFDILERMDGGKKIVVESEEKTIVIKK